MEISTHLHHHLSFSFFSCPRDVSFYPPFSYPWQVCTMENLWLNSRQLMMTKNFLSKLTRRRRCFKVFASFYYIRAILSRLVVLVVVVGYFHNLCH
jgi:hypothetical protein